MQVLCIVPAGYEYKYHGPWNREPISFKTDHKYIGVATKGDTIPSIVKAGMALSEFGISYGDADTDSNWKNPTKHAWDDFDWMRYACEKANDEDEAASLMTKDVVKKMHATAVSENLFIVGPNKGIVIEADAFHYKVREIINGIAVMSNYPKELWKTQIFKKLPISKSFDTVAEKYVRKGGVVKLKSLYGVRIVEIGSDFIIAKPVSLVHALKTSSIGVVTKIQLGERKIVGYYSVELLDINGNRAKVRVCNNFKAWEEKMLGYIQPRYGEINVKDMFNWSRLEKQDLDDLRPMCEGFYEYEAVAVYRIPKQNYETLSNGWFSPNHACSSIYVPFHICDNNIYDPYETGEAAQLSLDLFNIYDHKNLANNFSKVEDVFFYEIDSMEEMSTQLLKNKVDISDFMTAIDTGMQKQAFLTEQIWLEASKISDEKDKQEIINIIDNFWEKNYSFSLNKMKTAFFDLEKISGSNKFQDKIIEIALNICKSRIDAAAEIGKQSATALNEYEKGSKLIKQGQYESGFQSLQKSFTTSNLLIKGETPEKFICTESSKNEGVDLFLYFLIALLVLVIISLVVRVNSD